MKISAVRGDCSTSKTSAGMSTVGATITFGKLNLLKEALDVRGEGRGRDLNESCLPRGRCGRTLLPVGRLVWLVSTLELLPCWSSIGKLKAGLDDADADDGEPVS